jgi:hypothetical protein
MQPVWKKTTSSAVELASPVELAHAEGDQAESLLHVRIVSETQNQGKRHK